MSEDFKRKLEAYEKGELTDVELEEFEKEMEKLENDQDFLEKNNQDNKRHYLNNKKHQKIIRRSKWKARLNTAFFAFGIILLLIIVSSTLTGAYYAWGSPDRSEVYREVIDHTLTITNPYGNFGTTSTNATAFFGLETTRDLNKKVGNDIVKVGEFEVNFRFSIMGLPERQYNGNASQNTPSFTYPEIEERGVSDWNQLEQLPEGTVVSSYVSFSELMGTKEVFEQIEDQEMDLLWLAVDTGFDETDDFHEGVVFEPIGFPSYPIWHENDMILDSREEEKGLFGNIVSEGYSSPEYTEGDTEVLHKQFMKTLSFLKEHESKAKNLYYGESSLSEQIEYLNKEGIKHYGAVITGPTKEVLKLNDESWVRELEVDEVRFWNWNT